METEIKRWSMPLTWVRYNPDEDATAVPDSPEGIERQLHDLYFLTQRNREIVETMRQSNFDPKKCEEAQRGYDYEETGYVDEDNKSIFPLQDQMYIVRTLQKLTEQGYDVRPQWRLLRNLLKDIWEVWPDFYKGEIARFQYEPHYYPKSQAEYLEAAKVPPNYDLNKPFPQYEIPADIDEDVQKD